MSDDVAQEPSEASEPFNWKACCLLPVGALAALWLIVMVFAFAAPEKEPEPSSAMASYHCRDMVKENLKDPKSAEFSNEVISGHGTYKINGTVRSENSFGGMAVNEYECDVKWGQSDDGYFVTVRIF